MGIEKIAEKNVVASPVELGSAPAGCWKHLCYLALIAAVALAPRLVATVKSVSPARDAFKYFRAADAFERLPFEIACRSIDVHPLYPYSLYWARWLTGHVVDARDPYVWWRVGQVWSILCYLAFLFVAYAAGALIFRPTIALLGCLAISMAPRQIGYSVDVLSDNLLALLWMASFSLIVWHWQKPAIGKLFAAGALAGLAYCTHVGALLLPMSLAVTALLVPWTDSQRPSVRSSLTMLGCFSIACLSIIGGYAFLNGGMSPRLVARDLLGEAWYQEPSPDPLESERVGAENSPAAPLEPTPDDALGSAEPVALPAESNDLAAVESIQPFRDGSSIYVKTGVWPATWRMLCEFGEETRYWLLALAAFGLVARWRTLLANRGSLFSLVAIAGSAAMLVALQMKAGYSCGRYALPVLPLIAMLAFVGAEALLARWRAFPRFAWERSWSIEPQHRRRTGAFAAAFGAICLVLCAPGWFRTQHDSRSGHMQAARWLKTNTDSRDVVLDPSACSSFFAERATWEPVGDVPAALPFRYALLDPDAICFDGTPMLQAVLRAKREGRLVAQFPEKPSSSRIGIYIMEMPGAQTNQDARSLR